MSPRLSIWLAPLLLAACAPATRPPAIDIQDAWARATATGQSSAAFYATIVNRGGPDTLTGVSSPAGMAMLHQGTTTNGVARMAMVASLPIAADATVKLAPGATHVMVGAIKAPLAPGQSVDLTLRFAISGEKRVRVGVVSASAR